MIELMKRTFISLVLLSVVAVPGAFALSEARLLGLSESGQTALFNLGLHDGVKEGDYAVIVKEIRDLSHRDLRVVPVARARNVKLNTGNSVWILFKVFDAELLVKGQPFLIFSESEMLRGRRDPRFGRLSVVSDKDKASLRTQDALSGDKERLAKLKNQYPEIAPIHDGEMRTDGDGELVDVDGWKKFGKEKYRTALYRSPHQKDFQRQLRLDSFDKIVTAYLNKVNEPGFNYDQFYDQQMKTVFSNEFRRRSNFDTEYENFISYQAQRAVQDAKIYRAILEKGDSWSEDFSDDELKAVLKQVSVLQEKDRRSFVMAEPKRYTLYFAYGLPLNDNQTDKDLGYRRDSRYTAELDFEGTPILKHETLERFTLNATVRANKTAIDTTNRNTSVDELSVSGGVNWYPLYPPHAIEAPAVFVGSYVRSGTASLETPSANEKGNYTVLCLPGFRGGLKYNFKNNVGLRIALSMETLQLDRYEQSKTGGVQPDHINVVEAKMNIAMAYSF